MIMLHHMNVSQSTRALWLLDELGLHYERVQHQRAQNFRMPPSLAAIHPLGKAPVIVDDGLVSAEPCTILHDLG